MHSCVQVAARTHPDLIVLQKQEDKSFLPLELIIGDKDHRLSQGLCHDLGLKPFMGGRKIAILDDADYLNAEGANALLKTLEEPPPRSVLILIGTSPAKQLPTIRSRCQLIRFQPLATATAEQFILQQGIASDATEARRLASQCAGSLQKAADLSDPELWKFRGTLYGELAQPHPDYLRLMQEVVQFVDAAGKEAPPRRRRLHQIVQFAADFYAGLLRADAEAFATDDEELYQAIQNAFPHATDAERIVQRLDRCLETDQQIDRNVHQVTLIESWINGLAS